MSHFRTQLECDGTRASPRRKDRTVTKGAGMIRDFTKSALGFSWALSLLGLKQAVNLLRPNQQQDGDLLAPMTQVAVNQLDDSMRGIYRSGDNLQARTVDLMFAALNPTNWLNPNAWLRSFTGQGNC